MAQTLFDGVALGPSLHSTKFVLVVESRPFVQVAPMPEALQLSLDLSPHVVSAVQEVFKISGLMLGEGLGDGDAAIAIDPANSMMSKVFILPPFSFYVNHG